MKPKNIANQISQWFNDTSGSKSSIQQWFLYVFCAITLEEHYLKDTLWTLCQYNTVDLHVIVLRIGQWSHQLLKLAIDTFRHSNNIS